MIPHEIKTEHVLAAIAEIKATGIPCVRNSKGYVVIYAGERYPPKYVVSLAAKHALGRELRPTEFSGGLETNNFLRKLGFEIVTARVAGDDSTKPKPAIGDKSGRAHNERCRECKATVSALLQRLYGAVEVAKRFPIGAMPEALKESSYADSLQAIHISLGTLRGFRDFVRSSTLPPCDYFVPNPGFIVEFDESQHFTELRELALSQYPSSLALAFDPARWRSLCRQIKARDNDPIFRDEQRAWYDTVRDFLPTLFQLKPTVRLYAGEYPWCTLDPNRNEDVEKFRQILSERTYVWAFKMGDFRNQRFARLVMDGAWAGDLNASRRLLGDVAAAWPSRYRSACLCTCGAFLRFDWPEDLPSAGNLDPGERELLALIGAAEKAVRKVLTRDFVDKLRACCEYITLGVDTRKDQVSTTFNVISQPHAELVCIVDLRKVAIHWTGKFYPTCGQKATIVRFPDLQSHFVKFDLGTVMILGCHDLSVYSPWQRRFSRPPSVPVLIPPSED